VALVRVPAQQLVTEQPAAIRQIEMVTRIGQERNVLAVDEPLDIGARCGCNYNTEQTGHPIRSLHRRR
jgi:hypothetical protein